LLQHQVKELRLILLSILHAKEDVAKAPSVSLTLSILIKHWAREFSDKHRLQFVKLFFDVLVFIEMLAEKHVHVLSHRSQRPRQVDDDCEDSGRNQRRRVLGPSVSMLHGELSDHEEQKQCAKLLKHHHYTGGQRQRWFSNSGQSRNKKEVYNADTSRISQTEATSEYVALSRLRDKCFRSFVTICGDFGKKQGEAAIRDFLLDVVCNSSRACTYDRLCALIMGDAGRLCSSRLIPYRDIVTAVWSRAVEAANPCSLLSLYVELLVE